MKAPVWKYVAIGGACLALGVAGSAGASSLITGKSIKDGSIGTKDLSKKARKALTGKAGARGATGARGPQGPAGRNGAPGGPGTSGSTAPALMLGVMGASAGADRFAPPVGGGGTQGTETGALTPVPPGTTLVARDFAASVPVAPGAGESITITFRVNQVDTGLACTIASSATSCSAPGATIALPAGARMSMHSTASAGATASVVSWGFRIVF